MKYKFYLLCCCLLSFLACQQQERSTKSSSTVEQNIEEKSTPKAETSKKQPSFGFFLNEDEFPKLKKFIEEEIQQANQFALQNVPDLKAAWLHKDIIKAFKQNDYALLSELCYASPEEMQYVFVESGTYNKDYITEHAKARRQEAQTGFKNIQELWTQNQWSREELKLAYVQYVFDDVANGIPFFTLHVYGYFAKDKELIKMTFADTFCLEKGECKLTRAMERLNFYSMQEGGVRNQ